MDGISTTDEPRWFPASDPHPTETTYFSVETLSQGYWSPVYLDGRIRRALAWDSHHARLVGPGGERGGFLVGRIPLRTEGLTFRTITHAGACCADLRGANPGREFRVIQTRFMTRTQGYYY